MKSKNIVFGLILMQIFSLQSFAVTLNVGTGKTYANPSLAAGVAQPGDTILIHPGTYLGTFWISNLSGRENAWIVIMGTNAVSVILNAGSEGFHFSDVSYIKIQNMTFSGHTSNSMNIDDAGTFETPAKHLIVANCIFKNMGANGNNDFLKLSGLDSFEVTGCQFRKAAAGGSGIDMVGCHYGIVRNCTFDSMGSNSIQMKGGTQFIKIENNIFTNGGQRSLNLGGSTGLAFFRPQDAKFEAADIQVYANLFKGSEAPIAYVGAERVDVANNTIYLPGKWVMRILQETVDTTRFVPCRNNMFRNNIVWFSSAVSTHVNIGPNTSPNTFLFSHNLWYNSSNPSSSAPNLPTTEASAITGQNPLFTATDSFTLQMNSPAKYSGVSISGLPKDLQGFNFMNPPSRGAYEYGSGVSVKVSDKVTALIAYPNPTFSEVCIENIKGTLTGTVVNAQGQIVFSGQLEISAPCISLEPFSSGLYHLILTDSTGQSSSYRLIKQ
jgi:hypothetical protein